MAIGQITTLFPNSKSSYISNSFALDESVSLIKIIGMQWGDKAQVEVQVGEHECDKWFVPYKPTCCGQLEFCYPQNEFYLTVPNVYRLVLTNRFNTDITDDSRFTNVRIYQSPVDSDYMTNIALQGNNDMSCMQEIACTPEGITIDGVLCAPIDTYVSSVVPSAGGWTLVMNDGTTRDVPLTSNDGTVTIVGNDISVEDTYLESVTEIPQGWNLMMNNGAAINLPLYSTDGSVSISGGDLSVEVPIPFCESVQNLPRFTARVGG